MIRKICLVVSNNLLYDSRVRKEASSLSLLAKEVTVIAKRDASLQKVEVLGGKIKVKRVGEEFPPLPLRPKRWIPWYKLVKALIKERANIYHANDPDTLLACYIASRINRGKIVYDSHELWTSPPKEISIKGKILYLFIKWIEGFLAQRADLVLATTPLRAMEMKRVYGLKRSPFLLLNCPPYQRISERKYFDRYKTEGEKIILYLGGIQPGRGLFQVVEAIENLRGCKFIIMGPISKTHKALAHRLKEFIREKGIENRVIILPPVSPDRVVEAASSADIGIAPIENIKKSYFYSLPNKLFEYIQAELPIAASDFPEMRKIVLGYGIGRTFNPDNPSSIKRALQEILKRDVYKECKRNLKKAKEVFHWEREEEKLKRAYKDIL